MYLNIWGYFPLHPPGFDFKEINKKEPFKNIFGSIVSKEMDATMRWWASGLEEATAPIRIRLWNPVWPPGLALNRKNTWSAVDFVELVDWPRSPDPHSYKKKNIDGCMLIDFHIIFKQHALFTLQISLILNPFFLVCTRQLRKFCFTRG